MQTRDTYKKQLQGQLTQWDKQIDILAAKTRNPAADVRAGYAQELEELRMMQRKAREKILELENASDDSWQKVKLTADHLWHNLRIGVADYLSIFRR